MKSLFPDTKNKEQDVFVHQLLSVNRRFYDAFEKLDISEMASVWAHNQAVSCMHPSPGWKLLRGWDHVKESWELIFSRIRSIRFELSDLRVVLAGEIAWVILTEHLQAFSMDLEEEIRESSIATNIFEYAGNTWRLIHHHATPLLLDTEENYHPETLPNVFEVEEDLPLPSDHRDTLKHSPKKPKK